MRVVGLEVPYRSTAVAHFPCLRRVIEVLIVFIHLQSFFDISSALFYFPVLYVDVPLFTNSFYLFFLSTLLWDFQPPLHPSTTQLFHSRRSHLKINRQCGSSSKQTSSTQEIFGAKRQLPHVQKVNILVAPCKEFSCKTL